MNFFHLKGKGNQYAGDNSKQYQIKNSENIVINNGITEQRAREIYAEMIPHTLQEYTNEAAIEASNRIERLENKFMPYVQKSNEIQAAFSDPAFQILLKKAQRTAACTDKEDDYEILSELLSDHVKCNNDRKARTGIQKAIEIIDQIDNDALCALTISYFVKNAFNPIDFLCKDKLHRINNFFKKINLSDLPKGNAWIDHLDILGAIRITPFLTMEKCIDHYIQTFSDSICIGIKLDSKEYNQTIQLLSKINMDPSSVLINNELLDNYVRLTIRNNDSISDLSIASFDGHTRKINDNEVKAITEIMRLYSHEQTLQEKVNSNFQKLWDSHNTLITLRSWWDSIPMSFDLTQVGVALAHTNVKRYEPSIPDLPR